MPRTTIEPFIIRPPADLAQTRPDIVSLAKQLSLQYVHQKVVPEDSLKKMGQALWQVLQIDDEFAKAKQQAGLQILPLIIDSRTADIFTLPWECLYHPDDGFLGKHVHYTLSRQWLGSDADDAECRQPQTEVENQAVGFFQRVLSRFWRPASVEPAPLPQPAEHSPGTQPDFSLPKGPLRVLLFTSQPDDLEPETMRLDIETEQAHVLEALDPFISQGLVQIETPDDGRFSSLCALLRDDTFHLVFLSGHGLFATDAFSQVPNQATFLFEGEDGLGHRVAAAEIAQAFVGTQVQCVVLSACQSGKTSSADLNAGLMTSLAAAGLPHVIGMRESIFDHAGILFAHRLCHALARQEQLTVAIQQGREAITQVLQTQLRPLRDTSGLAEASLGQWCLPMLVSHEPMQGLIDWEFTPKPPASTLFLVDSLADNITLPSTFIGRRRELRELGQALATGRFRQLLITGPGGQGKTALAGQLARKLEKQGYLVHAYSARPPESSWENFIFHLKSSLNDLLLEQVERRWGLCTNEQQRAQLLLNALLQHSQGSLLLFFDNLESLQAPDSGVLTDATLAAWLTAAQRFNNLLILLTSRWVLPNGAASTWIPASAGMTNVTSGWVLPNPTASGQHHHILARPSYGDFLRYLQQLGFNSADNLPANYTKRDLYNALGGNFKGLQLFHSAQQLGIGQTAFLERVRTAQAGLQIYMAIEQVVSYLQPAEKTLLYRLPVYTTPVTDYGITDIAHDLAEPVTLLHRLVALSLVDAEQATDLHNNPLAYQISPLVAEWLQAQRIEPPNLELRQQAAAHQQWLFEHGRKTIAQAITVHEALQLAELSEQADRFALDVLVPYFDRVGMYRTLLDNWLPRLRESSEKSVQGEALGMSGKICLHISDYYTALDYLQQSLSIRREIGDKSGEGTTLNNLSALCHARGDYDTATDYLLKSLSIQRETGDKGGEGTTLNNLSGIYQAQGDYDTAEDYLLKSLSIIREIGDKSGFSVTLNNLSTLCYARGDYDTAEDYLQQSLSIQREIGDKSGEGTTLNNLSQIYDARSDYDAALNYLQQSLFIIREIGDKGGEGTTLNNLSQIYDARGDYDAALDYLQQSLSIRREIGDKGGEGTALNNLSTLFHARGDYDTAEDYLLKSLSIRREIGDKSGEGTTLNNLSALFHALGDYDTALDYMQQSLSIQREIGDKSGEGTILNNLSQVFQARGDYDAALDYLQQSLQIRRQIGDRAGEGTALNNISQVFQARGDYDTALDYLQQSLTIRREIGDQSGLCATLFNMGHIYMTKKDKQQAIAHWLTVYQIATQIGEAQALAALEGLAKRLGGEGLVFWEILAGQMDNTDDTKKNVQRLQKSIRLSTCNSAGVAWVLERTCTRTLSGLSLWAVGIQSVSLSSSPYAVAKESTRQIAY